MKGKPKVVVYWLAELTSGRDPTLSDEHTEFKFLPKHEIKSVATFPDFLKMVEQFEVDIKKLHNI